jgi:hypothetical protein
MNLVTPKAGAKHELLFNEPASRAYSTGELVKRASLGQAPASLENIRLGWKPLPGTRALDYKEHL